jgi:two-component system, cell cycle sensor histidine kinase and response regulator CckA
MSAQRREARTVLVVDDDRAFRDVVRDVLEGAGYRVLVAQNALEALQVNRTFLGSIHLALVDVAMPLLDGIAVAEHLRKKRPLRLLLMSGHPDAVVPARAGMHRTVAFIQKPRQGADLLRAVREALETA